MSQQLTLEGKPLEDKPLEDIRSYRWITLGEQKAFISFLKMVGAVALLHEWKLEWCASEWEKFRCCSNYSHTKKVHYIPCGCRGHCPRCSMSYAHKRANIQYQWIKINLADKLPFGLKMNQIVLTLTRKLNNMDSKIFTKMVRKFMGKFSEAYGYCIQNTHSKDPLGEKYLHCHVLSLNIKKGSVGIEKSGYYFDVDSMRERWKEIISEFTGEQVEGEVNLYTEYASILKDKQKIVHMLAYLYRYPVQDLFQVQIRDGSINYVQNLQIDSEQHTNTLQVDVFSKIFELVDQKKPRIIWCGLLTSSKRKLLMRLIGVGKSLWLSLTDVEKMLDRRSKECVDCGCLYEIIPFDRGWYQGDNEPDITMLTPHTDTTLDERVIL